MVPLRRKLRTIEEALEVGYDVGDITSSPSGVDVPLEGDDLTLTVRFTPEDASDLLFRPRGTEGTGRPPGRSRRRHRRR